MMTVIGTIPSTEILTYKQRRFSVCGCHICQNQYKLLSIMGLVESALMKRLSNNHQCSELFCYRATGHKTIESELVKALLQSNLIDQSHADDMSKVSVVLCV